ncbi:hypothetical protein [Aeoliella sp.]|uniref:hypothetical protein n=1 Tax=Aeoliella sp. TaxID=2795800 RepID=UPI003CCBDE1F
MTTDYQLIAQRIRELMTDVDKEDLSVQDTLAKMEAAIRENCSFRDVTAPWQTKVMGHRVVRLYYPEYSEFFPIEDWGPAGEGELDRAVAVNGMLCNILLTVKHFDQNKVYSETAIRLLEAYPSLTRKAGGVVFDDNFPHMLEGDTSHWVTFRAT